MDASVSECGFLELKLHIALFFNKNQKPCFKVLKNLQKKNQDVARDVSYKCVNFSSNYLILRATQK
jgi:hypothetical protein